MGDTLLATGEPEGRFRADRAAALPRYSVRYLHLTALWAYGVSQPVLSLVDANVELVVLYGLSRTEVVALAVALLLFPPLVALSYVWLAGRLSRWVGDALFLWIVAGFMLPCAFLVATTLDLRLLHSLAFVVAAVGLGVLAYARSSAARLFLSFSVVLPAVGLATFTSGLPALTERAEAAAAPLATPHPIVLVVYDELPLNSLLSDRGAIDEERFPNFARLARDATWYPNATTVSAFSSHAVPAILTGNVPSHDAFPGVFDHPNNLFTLLAGGYSMNVFETSTRLCPEEYCIENREGLRERLEGIFSDISFLYFTRVIPAWAGGIKLDGRELVHGVGRETQIDYGEFLDQVDRSRSNRSLSYVHLLLPHVPWRYLPSGREYPHTQTHGLSREWEWPDDEWTVRQAQQRHLLQLGHADRQLGRLLDRLVRSGLYDRALVTILADHGAAFRPKLPFREVTSATIADVGFVPLFVKYPGQRVGRIDARRASLTDVLPTIADVIGLSLPQPVRGSSLLAPPRQRTLVEVARLDGTVVRAPVDRVDRRFAALVERKNALFGGSWDSTYRIGTNVRLLGRRVAPPRARTGPQVMIDDAEEFLDVNRAASALPVHVSGQVVGGRIDRETEMAVVVNGRVTALTRCVEEDGRQRFRAMLPERALRDGRNRIDVYAIHGGGSATRLVWLGTSGGS